MTQIDQTWERYQGGSPEAEREQFAKHAKAILEVQSKLKARSKALGIERAFHAKPILATDKAVFRVDGDLPEDLSVGFMVAGAEYPATIRLSNASGIHQADGERDLRGAAVRVKVDSEEIHDLLMTNFPVPHARNADQFVAFAQAMSGNRIIGILKLMFKVGPRETVRMMRNVMSGANRPVASLALESYWSRGAILWGEAGPVRYFIRPGKGAGSAPAPEARDAGYLRAEIAERLAGHEIEYEFCIQRFVDERTTPVEDAAVEWTETASPPIPVATIVIPKQDVTSTEAQATARRIEQMAFNPWHTTEDFRPLGNINRARKAVYEASAAHRRGRQFNTLMPWRNRVTSAGLLGIFSAINRRIDWHRLPLTFSLLNLSLLRHQLRQKNLIDSDPPEAPPRAEPKPAAAEAIPEDARLQRSFSGEMNDLAFPKMGAVGCAFGRNMAPVYEPGMFDTPNAVTVSQELLYRKHFIPAASLNVLAAAWIQFQVHDWVQHATYPLGTKDIRVPMPDGRTWENTVGGPAEHEMRIAGDKEMDRLYGSPDGPPIVFGNQVSHWWDGSEVYGADEAKARSLRETPEKLTRNKDRSFRQWDGARIRLDDGYLPEDVDGMAVTGFNESWWLGLSAMHTLFAREHNAVCDALRSEYRDWNDDKVYHTARLVVSALIAKIHTIEWTPAILATDALNVGMNANWSGAPSDIMTRFGLWLTDVHAIEGIPDTVPDHHTAPYALTEDFVTVYRLHPLLPDDYRFYRHEDGSFNKAMGFNDLQGAKTDEVMRDLGLRNVLYSLGIAHPGAITLHNYPRTLQKFERNGEFIDLSVVDIMRERTRGIPRYNGFRKGLHKKPITRWEDLTANPESVRLLREVYKHIDEVDTMVGLTAETPPPGFGFSDTAFRIFILMATRRLQSDRFLNVDFRPEVYSPLGYQWVQENGMTSVILRHHPELAAVIPRERSAFAPWRPVETAPANTTAI